MADYSPPKSGGDFTPPEPGSHEAYVSNVTEVPNNFYNPAKDKPNKKTQFKWTFTIRDGEFAGKRVTYWTGTYFSRNEKNKLTNLVKVTDDEFDINVGYSGDGEFIERNLYRPLRIMTDNVTKTNSDGEERTYPRVLSILKSKTGPLSKDEMDKAVEEYLGLERIDGEERPF